MDQKLTNFVNFRRKELVERKKLEVASFSKGLRIDVKTYFLHDQIKNKIKKILKGLKILEKVQRSRI